jgi:hypothetical protein
MLRIPVLEDTAFWTQRMTLEGTDYVLSFSWNGRAEAWFVELLDLDSTPLLGPLKLTTNRPLFLRHHYLGTIPPGELFAFDPTYTIDAPDYTELGTSVELFYLTADEVAATRAGA